MYPFHADGRAVFAWDWNETYLTLTTPLTIIGEGYFWSIEAVEGPIPSHSIMAVGTPLAVFLKPVGHSAWVMGGIPWAIGHGPWAMMWHAP